MSKLKFKVFGQPKESVQTVYFTSYIDEIGNFHVDICDENGEIITGDNVLYISPSSGKLYLNRRVNEECGLALDKDGRIKVG